MGEIKVVPLTHKIRDALVNIDQRDLMLEVIEKTIIETERRED